MESFVNTPKPMSDRNKTLNKLSYGLANPLDLYEKLKADAVKLGSESHPYDIFNFVVTAAVLAEWIQKYYKTASFPESFRSPSKSSEDWTIPSRAASWIKDTSCLPNPADAEREIKNALALCAHTANASKHFHWADKGHVQAISACPPISGWYQHLFTSRDPDIYFTIQGDNYGLQQVKGILLQFYGGLLGSLNGNFQDDLDKHVIQPEQQR